ncbi:hypothetical protein ABZ250_35110 [Streptomyces afghaniensis]|uniref:hypothetical protein n=1 Tax=Streptomyces afghaniensis TaxID=66865 RepID=UPI0033AEF019
MRAAPAVAQGELAALKVAEKLVPFLRGDSAVFLDRPQSPASGDERSMCLDGFRRVDGGVSHRRSDVVVTSNDLGDVGWQVVGDGVRDEDPTGRIEGYSALLRDQPGIRNSYSACSLTSVPPLALPLNGVIMTS